MESGDAQPRVLGCDPGHGAGDHVLARAEEVGGEPFLLHRCEQRAEQVDAGNSLGERHAEQPAGPDERQAVGVDDRRPLQEALERGAPARLDDLGSVERELRVVAVALHQRDDAIDRLGKREHVDGATEEGGAADRGRGGCHRRGAPCGVVVDGMPGSGAGRRAPSAGAPA